MEARALSPSLANSLVSRFRRRGEELCSESDEFFPASVARKINVYHISKPSLYLSLRRREGAKRLRKSRKKTGLTSREERREGQIQGVSSTVKQGDVFVNLAGHPLALRTPKNNDLWLVAFLVDAQDNQRNFLGGMCV